MQEQAILFEQKVTNGLVLDSDVLLDDLSDAPPQYSLIVQLALLIGARRGEICALRGQRSGLGISFTIISYRVLIALLISKMRNLSFACLLFYLDKKCDILQNCHSIGG